MGESRRDWPKTCMSQDQHFSTGVELPLLRPPWLCPTTTTNKSYVCRFCEESESLDARKPPPPRRALRPPALPCAVAARPVRLRLRHTRQEPSTAMYSVDPE